MLWRDGSPTGLDRLLERGKAPAAAGSSGHREEHPNVPAQWDVGMVWWNLLIINPSKYFLGVCVFSPHEEETAARDKNTQQCQKGRPWLPGDQLEEMARW